MNNDKVAVKTIYLKDQTIQKCRVSLLREISEAHIRPGDHIRLANVVLNVYRGESSLSTTSLTKLQKCEAPETEQTITVIGCSVEDIEVLYLLIDGVDVTIPLDVVRATFNTEDDLENYIIEQYEAGLDMKIHSKGSEILKLSLI